MIEELIFWVVLILVGVVVLKVIAQLAWMLLPIFVIVAIAWHFREPIKKYIVNFKGKM